MQDTSPKSPPYWLQSLAAFWCSLPGLVLLHLAWNKPFEPFFFFLQAALFALGAPWSWQRSNHQEETRTKKRPFAPSVFECFLTRSSKWFSLNTMGALFAVCGVAACAIQRIVGSINAWQVVGITVGVPLYLCGVGFATRRLHACIEKRDAQKRQRAIAAAGNAAQAEEPVAVPEVTAPLPQTAGYDAVERVELQNVLLHGRKV